MDEGVGGGREGGRENVVNRVHIIEILQHKKFH